MQLPLPESPSLPVAIIATCVANVKVMLTPALMPELSLKQECQKRGGQTGVTVTQQSHQPSCVAKTEPLLRRRLNTITATSVLGGDKEEVRRNSREDGENGEAVCV